MGEYSRLWKPVLLYAAALAIGVFALEWLQYRYLARAFGIEIFFLLVALGFAGLGAWLAVTLTRRAPAPDGFVRNEAALASLAITPREYEVLEGLVSGASNKQIARRLGCSPNTVKTHAASLYRKLEVTGRVGAIEKARFLSLIP